MGTVATEVSGNIVRTLNISSSGRGSSARIGFTNIGDVVPHKRRADAHPVLDKVPDVPLAKEDPIAVELLWPPGCRGS